MARAFAGSGHDIHFSTGALSGFTHGTVAAILRYTNFNAWSNVFALHNSGGTFLGSVAISQTGGIPRWYTGQNSDATTGLPTGVWVCLVARKATGAAAARFSWYRYDTGAWVHENGGATSVNATAPGASGSIRFVPFVGDVITGDCAIRAAWANTLPWTSDTTGDAALESSGLQFSLNSWFGANPSALWLFDQADVAQTIPDLTGGGAQQSSITGTSVSANSVPSFSYGSDLLEVSPEPAQLVSPNGNFFSLF